MSSPFTLPSGPNKDQDRSARTNPGAAGSQPEKPETKPGKPQAQSGNSQPQSGRPEGNTPWSRSGASADQTSPAFQAPVSQPHNSRPQPDHNQQFTQGNQGQQQQGPQGSQGGMGPYTGANYNPYQRQGTTQTGKKDLNYVGIAGIAVAVIGIILAFFKPTIIAAWLCILIALALVVAGFIVKNKERKTVIGALVLTGILGLTAIFTTGKALMDAGLASISYRPHNDTHYSEKADPSQKADEDSSDDAVPSKEDGKDDADQDKKSASKSVGTRANPYKLGQDVETTEWVIKINSFKRNADKEVLAANRFNEPPADGNEYAIANVTAKYKGSADPQHPDEAGIPSLLRVTFVAEDGKSYNRTSHVIVYDSTRNGSGELYEGGTATFNEVIEVPKGAKGVITMRPSYDEDPVFIKVQK